MAEQRNGPVTTAEALQIFAQMTHRLSLRQGVTFDGARDMYATLGYPDEISYQDYYARYKRGGIAKTIIDAFVEETWRRRRICAKWTSPRKPRRRRLRRPGNTSPNG